MDRYRTEGELKRAIKNARTALDKSEDMRVLYKRLRAEYPKRLIGQIPEQKTTPSETAGPQAEIHLTAEQSLAMWRKNKSKESEAVLIDILGGIMDSCAEEASGHYRPEAIDLAWEEFYNVINSAMPWDMIPQTLEANIKNRIARFINSAGNKQ